MSEHAFVSGSASALRLGIPKGSLQEATVALFRRAGFRLVIPSRSYYPRIDAEHITCILLRAQEMGRYVESGLIDAGLTGLDWVLESGVQVRCVADLAYAKTGSGRARWVVAVPQDSPIRTVAQLQGTRIATEAVQLTRQYLERQGIEATVEFSWGATEVKPPYLADAIVEITETGASLRANGMRIVETVLETHTQLIANHASWADVGKRKAIEELAILLRGAIAAEGKVGLMMNIRHEDLQGILAELPAMQNPTISRLTDERWVDLMTVLDERVARALIPQLYELGARGIVEFPLNKVVE